MKKIFTLFAALAMVMSMSAATKTIYCKMAQNWWKSDGAAVGAYAWKDGGASNAAWPGVRMTKVAGETDLWSIDIDASKFNKIIFTRVNGSGTVADWGAKTADQNIPTDDKNLFTITSSSAVWGDPGCTGTWSTYAPDAPKTYKDITITITANAAASIKWSDAGDKLANATAYVAMTAGENNTYSYTLAQVDEASGVNFTIKVGDIESASKNTNTNFTADFKELMKKVVVKGVNSWEDKDIMTVSDDYLTASITLPLVVKKYDLKLTIDGAWKGHKNENNITRAKNSSVFKNDDGNGSITADIAGDYVFTYTYANQTLTVTYPALPVKYNVTVTANAEGENVVSGAGEYEEGEEVTVTASEDLEGWVFIGWTEDGEFVANDPEYTFVVKGDVELVAVYAMDLGENEVTDLVIDGDNMLLTGSVAGFPMGTMNLELALGEYDKEEGTFLLTEDSKLYVGETNFTFVDGMAAVDMSTNSAMAMVVFEHNEAYYYMTVIMSKKIEATVIEIDNATVTIEERSMGFGDEVYHVLKMESTWSDGETTYPVSLETTEFDQTKESQEVAASITVGGMGDEDPWLGSAEGDVTITVANGVVTVEGLLENAYAWPAPIAFDLTISGKLPVEKIAYELNGGAFPEVKVPTNAELWEAFKPYYNEYYDLARADQPIDKVSTFAPAKMQEIMTDEASEYKWLGDYVQSVATAAGVPLSTDMAAANEGGWRWAVHAFFNAAAGQYGAAGIDFTEAGKPEVWGAAYLAEYGVVLPTEPVDAPYTLPTPVKEGYTFVGWYDNAEGTGEAYTVIPAGWAGTLYAIWKQSPATALDNIAIEGKVVKTIINGQLIIIKNGVQYNAQGAVIK